MADSGAEISQQGIDVSRASDDQKVLDTRWVTLDILSEPTFDLTQTFPTGAPGGGFFGFATPILSLFTHNLDFLPAFDYEIDEFTCDDPAAIIDTSNFVSSGKAIYFVPSVGSLNTSVTLTISLRLRIFDLPVTEEYAAPVIQSTPLTSNTPSEYGAEFVDPGSVGISIDTATPEELSFSTKLRPLNILQHGTVKVPPPAGNISIDYNYGNPPLYILGIYYPLGLGASAQGNSDLEGPLVGALTFSGGRGTITDTNIQVGGVQSALAGSFAYILFKDPLNISS